MTRTLLLAAVSSWMLPSSGDAQATEVAPQPELVELYSRAGCPNCAAAEKYLEALAERRPLRVQRYDVGEDDAALARLRIHAERAAVAQVAVPALYVRGRLFLGFDSPETTGRAFEAWLDGRQDAALGTPAATCDPRAEQPCEDARPARASGAAGADSATLHDDGDDAMRVGWLGELRVRDLGLPLFTLAVGLVDGFNPCAMWVLLFVLSMLVHLKDRARMALVGGTFVVVSGVVYFAFMAAWLNFFLLVGISRVVQVVLGLLAFAIGSVHVKDFFAYGRGPSLSIPAAAKPGIYRRVREVLHAERLVSALFGMVVLAILVNMVELLCTAGLPAIYTQILTRHGVSQAGYYAYLALYNLAYIADDALMLIVAVVTLSQHKLQERGGRVLKLVSGLVMLALGLMLVWKPEWLAWT